MIDTHIHLNLKQYENDLEDVINRSFSNGIQKIICVGMDYESSLKAKEIAHSHKNIFFSAGYHPGYIDDYNEEEYIKTVALLDDNKAVAVGEIGIDLYWRQDNLDKQIEVFEKQINLAIKHNLPIIVHSRNSFDEIYKTILPYKGKIKGVFHCFSGTFKEALKVIDLGFYIGVDGPITYKNNDDLNEVVQKISLSDILIETDGPYLSPVPLRGRRNEPQNLIYVAEKIAEIKEMDIKKVIKETSINAYNLFYKMEEDKWKKLV